ncbi:involucrin-like [Hyperolius riggenbachi]|uniref:involucrin-like n=1 Tax=Hyperolius riggenbachi TaxID=752182 RepID=UPI0035A2E83E
MIISSTPGLPPTMILLQTGACALFLLIIQCQSAALPVMGPGQQGEPKEPASDEGLQSGQTRNVEKEVESLAGRFSEEKVKQCCRDSLPHYEQTQNCYEKPRGMTEGENSPCFKAFQKCCLHVKAYSQTPSRLHRCFVIELRQHTEREPTGVESEEQTEVGSGQQREAEPEEQTEVGLGQQRETEPEEQTEVGLGQQREAEPKEKTEEGLGQQREAEPEALTEEEPEEQTEDKLEEQREEEPEEELEEQTEEEPEEQSEDELEKQIEAEDFPGGDKQGQSLHLSLQLKLQLDNGRNVGLGGNQKSPINPADQPVQSGQTSIEEEIENLANDRFRKEKVKRCCRDSIQHYELTRNCFEKPSEMTEDENTPCFKAFQYCCLHVKDYYEKIIRIGCGIPPGSLYNATTKSKPTNSFPGLRAN